MEMEEYSYQWRTQNFKFEGVNASAQCVFYLITPSLTTFKYFFAGTILYFYTYIHIIFCSSKILQRPQPPLPPLHPPMNLSFQSWNHNQVSNGLSMGVHRLSWMCSCIFWAQFKYFGLVKLQSKLNVKIYESKHFWIGLDRFGLSWVIGLYFF